MKYLKFSFLVFSIILLAFLYGFGQKQASKSSKNKSTSTQSQISEDWKLIDLRNFSFILPKTMEDKKIQGIDSAVWRFEDEEMILNIDSGRYNVDFSDREAFESLTKPIEINGFRGHYFYINYLKPKSPQVEIYEIFKQKPLQEAIVFRHDKYSYTTFWVLYKNPEQQEISNKILYSIKFKQK